MIWLNSDNNPITWNKKQYLLVADQQLGLGVFKDIREATGETESVLNIQPCSFRMGTKWSGFWHIDVTLEHPYHTQYGMFDTAFLASSITKYPIYEKAVLLFQACEPTIHKSWCEPDVDFAMCGTNGGTGELYNKREVIYNAIKTNFTYRDYQKDHTIQEYSKMISHGRVQVVQPHTVLNDMTSFGSTAQRFFECLAIGPVLCDRTPDIQLAGNLIEDTDYMAYSTVDEFIDKMKLLLSNETLRRKIQENGRRKAIMYHTYGHRALTILNTVNDFLGNS